MAAEALQVGDFVTWTEETHLAPEFGDLNIHPSIMRVTSTTGAIVTVADMDGNQVAWQLNERDRLTFGRRIMDLFDANRFVKQDAFIAAMMQAIEQHDPQP